MIDVEHFSRLIIIVASRDYRQQHERFQYSFLQISNDGFYVEKHTMEVSLWLIASETAGAIFTNEFYRFLFLFRFIFTYVLNERCPHLFSRGRRRITTQTITTTAISTSKCSFDRLVFLLLFPFCLTHIDCVFIRTDSNEKSIDRTLAMYRRSQIISNLSKSGAYRLAP
jgi:hypothetical protein